MGAMTMSSATGMEQEEALALGTDQNGQLGDGEAGR